MADNFQSWISSFKVEIDPDEIESSIQTLQRKAKEMAADGRYTKVRVKFRGKQIVPEMPLAVFVAAEAATFWYAGLMRSLAFNLGARSLLEIEFVHMADEKIAAGVELFEEGEVDEAEECYREALEMAPHHPEANYRLAVLLRITARRDDAIKHFEKVAKGDSEWSQKAQQALDRMLRGKKTL
ncbi:MAG: hypothetical protein CMK59_07585 [Proteobacteria bacterium]|nr:hypothetical protein [Pseudomonadota bacterium]